MHTATRTVFGAHIHGQPAHQRHEMVDLYGSGDADGSVLDDTHTHIHLYEKENNPAPVVCARSHNSRRVVLSFAVRA